MSDGRLAGILLVVSALASFIGATMPSLARSSVWMLPEDAYFAVIREHEKQWRAHSWLFAVGTVIMGAGLAFIARSTQSAVAIASLFGYVVVAPLWLAHLAFRLDLTARAARDERARSAFEMLGPWTASLYTMFMVGGYYAVALLGLALVDGALVPPWTAWIVVVLGVTAGTSHWAGWPSVMGMRSPFDLPVLVQLVPLFVAIPLAVGGSG